jgi:hypothetical protein
MAYTYLNENLSRGLTGTQQCFRAGELLSHQLDAGRLLCVLKGQNKVELNFVAAKRHATGLRQEMQSSHNEPHPEGLIAIACTIDP